LNPVISIIIPTLNYANYLTKAVASIFETADKSNLPEVIIVDDGSTDNTKEVVALLGKKFHVIYIPQPPSGKAMATQKGIKAVKGEIIFTLDADDWFLPGKMEATLAIFNQYPQVVHVASPATIHWADGSRHDETESLPAWLTGKPIKGHEVLRRFMEEKMLFGGGSTFAARASVLKKMAFPAEVDMYTDEWLVMQVLLAGDTYFLPEPLSIWQVHKGNFSSRHSPAWAMRQSRLIHSSQAISDWLTKDANIPLWLKNAYKLKHATRLVEHNRLTPEYSIAFHYSVLLPLIFSGKFNLLQLWRYGTFKALVH
jgi:glycosyltransferase involved in cell wall biosynthesis